MKSKPVLWISLCIGLFLVYDLYLRSTFNEVHKKNYLLSKRLEKSIQFITKNPSLVSTKSRSKNALSLKDTFTKLTQELNLQEQLKSFKPSSASSDTKEELSYILENARLQQCMDLIHGLTLQNPHIKIISASLKHKGQLWGHTVKLSLDQ